MKLLLCLLTLALSHVVAPAASLKLNGNLTWQITEPLATFDMDGGIQNLSPAGSISGTLKLVLWATPRAFPSPGHVMGEYTLGRIGGGYQFNDFTVRTSSKIPNISGTYHFTLTVLEYTSAGWRTQLAVPTGTRTLTAGNFPTQEKWALPTAAIIAPPTTMVANQTLTLTPRSTSELNVLPADARQPFTVRIADAKKATVTRTTETNPANFKYSIKKLTYNKKKISTGSLALDYKAAGKKSTVSKGTLVLYYQTAGSGFYQNTETDFFGKLVTWGTFTLN